jgi:hypothetical protein
MVQWPHPQSLNTAVNSFSAFSNTNSECASTSLSTCSRVSIDPTAQHAACRFLGLRLLLYCTKDSRAHHNYCLYTVHTSHVFIQSTVHDLALHFTGYTTPRSTDAGRTLASWVPRQVVKMQSRATAPVHSHAAGGARRRPCRVLACC